MHVLWIEKKSYMFVINLNSNMFMHNKYFYSSMFLNRENSCNLQININSSAYKSRENSCSSQQILIEVCLRIRSLIIAWTSNYYIKWLQYN